MIKILIKCGLSSGALFGVVSFNSPSGFKELQPKLPENKEANTKLSAINSFEDIHIYEKQYGCNFAFVARWGDNKTYSAREFIVQENKLQTREGEEDWQKS